MFRCRDWLGDWFAAALTAMVCVRRWQDSDNPDTLGRRSRGRAHVARDDQSNQVRGKMLRRLMALHHPMALPSSEGLIMRHVCVKTVMSILVIGVWCINQGRAEFIKIDDFESYALGDINGQSDGSGTWTAASIQQVALEPNSTNQVLDSTASADETNSFNDDPNLTIADGTTGTLFFRIQRGTDVVGHIVYGLSDVATPGAWGDYEAGLGDRSSGNGFNGGSLDVRDAGTYRTLSEIGANEWINLWMVIDNGADTVQVYAQSDTTFPTQTLLDDDSGTTTFAFRNGTADPLTTFLLRTGTNHGSPYLLDDIYLDASGANLANPIPEPTSFVLFILALGGLTAAGFRRRHVDQP